MDENGYYDYLIRRRLLELKDQSKYTPIVQYVSENASPWEQKLRDAMDGFSCTTSIIDDMYEWNINVYQKFACSVEEAGGVMATIYIPDDSSDDDKTENRVISMSFDSVMGWGDCSSQ